MIGGAPRVGKSTIETKLLLEHKISFIPGDSLRKFVNPNSNNISLSEYEDLWQKTILFLGSLSKFQVDFVLEGIFITPTRIYKLFQESPEVSKIIRFVFFGQDSISP